MKAMIFAAGLGTRLKPFTLSHPKALAPVAGIPALGRVALKMRDAGVDTLVVNVHHFPDQIRQYLADNNNFGMDVHISDESDLLLETGGGILAAEKWLGTGDEPFIVHNADIITDFPVDDMLKHHVETKADVTLFVSDRDTSRYLLVDGDSRMRGWTNVNTGRVRPEGLAAGSLSPKAFGGVHIISPRVFEALKEYSPEIKPFSIMDFYISACNDLTINGYTPATNYRWHDIGKPESLAAADKDFANKQHNIK